MDSCPMSITISEDNYRTKEDLFKAITNILTILADNGYICIFKLEDCGIYVIEYDYEDSDLRELTPVWLKNEKLEAIINMRENEGDNE